jgi:hypothetical protein
VKRSKNEASTWRMQWNVKYKIKIQNKKYKPTLNITLFSLSASGELSLLSDGGLLLDLPDFWLEPLLLFEVPLCAELGRKVNRLGWTPADVMQRSKSWVKLAYNTQNLCIKLHVTLCGMDLIVQSRKHGEIFEYLVLLQENRQCLIVRGPSFYLSVKGSFLLDSYLIFYEKYCTWIHITNIYFSVPPPSSFILRFFVVTSASSYGFLNLSSLCLPQQWDGIHFWDGGTYEADSATLGCRMITKMIPRREELQINMGSEPWWDLVSLRFTRFYLCQGWVKGQEKICTAYPLAKESVTIRAYDKVVVALFLDHHLLNVSFVKVINK